MMEMEQIRERVDTIMQTFPETGDAPICQFLADDMDISHEDSHRLINSIAVAGAARGYTTIADSVMLGFTMGRKWGLIEAAQAIHDFDIGEDSNATG